MAEDEPVTEIVYESVLVCEGDAVDKTVADEKKVADHEFIDVLDAKNETDITFESVAEGENDIREEPESVTDVDGDTLVVSRLDDEMPDENDTILDGVNVDVTVFDAVAVKYVLNVAHGEAKFEIDSKFDCVPVTFTEREVNRLADDVTQKLPLTDIERDNAADFDNKGVEVDVPERIEVKLGRVESVESAVDV